MIVQEREPWERRCRMLWSVAAAVSAAVAIVVASGLRLDAAPPAAEEKPRVEAVEKVKKDVPEAPKGETLHYMGLVRDKDTGRPIAGATVVVRRSINTSLQVTRVLEESRHTTSALGTYAFTIPPEQVAEKGLYIELDVEHPDYATQAGFGYSLGMIRKNETMGERPFFENIELRPGKPITGLVQGPDGKAAPGVEILAFSKTDKTSPSGGFEYGSFSKAKTDGDGRFRVVLTTPGRAVFWILPKSLAPEMHPVPDGKRGDFGTFTLKTGVILKGRVFDAQGKPLAGLFIEAQRERGPGSDDDILNQLTVADAIQRTAETDAEGRFSFDPLPQASYRVQPVDYKVADGPNHVIRRPLPAVFAPRKLALKEGETPDPLEVRASPHVVIEGQWLDSKGKPRRGFGSFLGGQIDGGFWNTTAEPSPEGKFTVMVPHGLEGAQLQLICNEHGSLRHRVGKDKPLSSARVLMLGTLDHDVKDIEIVRYDAPIVMVNAKTKDGRRPRDLRISADYTAQEKGPQMYGKFILKGGVQSDVMFEEQGDGRFRSQQLVPDSEVTVTAHADGFKPATKTLSLPEGKTEEISLILEAR